MANYYLTADTSGATPPSPYDSYSVVNPNGAGDFSIEVAEDSNVVVAGDVDGNVDIGSVSGIANFNVETTVLDDTTGASAGSSDIVVNGGSENDIVSTIIVEGQADKFNITVGDGPANATSTLTVQPGASINNYTGSLDKDAITILGEARNITTGAGADTITIGAAGTVRDIDSGDDIDVVNVAGVARDVDTGDSADTLDVSGETRNIMTRGGADTITITSGATAGDVDSGNSDDIVTVAGTAGEIDSGDNDDQVIVTGTVDAVTTRSGQDVVTIRDTGSVTGGVSTGSGDDTVDMSNSASVGSNVETGTGGDVINLSNSAVGGDVDSASGSDSITLASGSTVGGSIVADIEASTTGIGDDTVVLDGSSVTGDILTYAGDDAVTLNNATVGGVLDTASNSDVVNLSGAIMMGGSAAIDAISTGSGADIINVASDTTFNLGGAINLQGNNEDLVNITPVTAAAKDVLVQAGYVYDSGRDVYRNDVDETFTLNGAEFQNVENANTGKVCFARGTSIETDRGAVPIERLGAGDLIATRDNGLQAIRWISSAHVSAEELDHNDQLRPIRIQRHALGNNIPSSDLVVSPQHRILIRSEIAKKMFGAEEVLVGAKHLCLIDGIDVAADIARVEYFHILFDHHEVVISNGAETESLYTGPEALKSIGEAARAEIFALFPELKDLDYTPCAARELAKGRMGRKLAVRHKQNNKSLVS